MRVPPLDVDPAGVADLIRTGWGLPVEQLRYFPVGFGSHHYRTRAGDDEILVTLDLLDPSNADHRRSLLERAFATALALGRLPSGGDLIAPLPSRDGKAALGLADRGVVTVFPFVADARHVTSETATATDVADRVGILQRLHAATGAVRDLAPVDDLAVDARAHLEAALDQLDEPAAGPWAAGPRSAGAQQVLAPRRDDLRRALRGYDRLAARVRTGRAGWVVTHGEPHWQNVLVTATGLRLVDWDTVRIGPAARDVWMIDDGDGDGPRRYTERTGRPVPDDELLLYRTNWDLTEISLYTRWFREPHRDDEDTAIAWKSYCRLLTPGAAWEALR